MISFFIWKIEYMKYIKYNMQGKKLMLNRNVKETVDNVKV